MRNINALPPCVSLCTIVFFYAWVPFAACCIWMRVFYRSGVYYDNVESLFGLKCHFVHIYQYQSDNCCQSVTGAANNQQLEDIYLADFSKQLKSHLVSSLRLNKYKQQLNLLTTTHSWQRLCVLSLSKTIYQLLCTGSQEDSPEETIVDWDGKHKKDHLFKTFL